MERILYQVLFGLKSLSPLVIEHFPRFQNFRRKNNEDPLDRHDNYETATCSNRFSHLTKLWRQL